MKNNEIGLRIRAIRNSKGLAQETLSHDAKIGNSTLQRIEAGKIDPKLGTILTIAEALGVEPYELFIDPKSPKPKPVDPAYAALAEALAARGSTIIPTEELEHLKANQIKSPELVEIIKMIDEFGDKRAYQKILRSMNISMENFALFFDMADPNKPKKTPSQESRPQTPQQETDKPLTQKKSS